MAAAASPRSANLCLFQENRVTKQALPSIRQALCGTVFAAVAISGCAVEEPISATSSSTYAQATGALTVGRTRLHPLVNANAAANAAGIQNAATTTTKLVYYGGKVIANVKVIAVNWGPNVNTTVASGIGGFYSAITGSAYFDWLSEYNTVGLNGTDGKAGSNQTIGHGSYAGQYTITPAISSGTVTDANIQAELLAQISAGSLPAPDANTMYMIDFPPAVSINDAGSLSCVQFCAYHGTLVYNGVSVAYGVHPDLTQTGCSTGCGTSAVMFNNATSVHSHELIEAVTDLEVGIGTTVARPLAWYNSAKGEIGDICNGQQGSIAGYTVQKEWSNSANACIVSKVVANTFNMTASSASLAIALGGSASTTLTSSIATGGAETITFAVSGLPAGVTATFSPASVSTGGSSVLTLTASPSASQVNASVTITATAPGGSKTAAIAVKVGNPPVILNGGVDTALTSWTKTGTASISTTAHSGTGSAMVGALTATATSSLAQTFTVPSGYTTLSFWYANACKGTVASDYATATLKNNGTGVTTTILAKTCTATAVWTPVSTAIAAGSYTLTWTNKDDGKTTTPSYTLFDDASVQ